MLLKLVKQKGDKFDHIFIETTDMKVERPSKESGGSAGHPCRSSRAEAATGDAFMHWSYIHRGATVKPGFDWRILHQEQCLATTVVDQECKPDRLHVGCCCKNDCVQPLSDFGDVPRLPNHALPTYQRKGEAHQGMILPPEG